VIDGLELLPGLAGLSKDRIASVRESALSEVRRLSASLRSSTDPEVGKTDEVISTSSHFGIGPFLLRKGPVPNDPQALPFAMQAPTTLDNLLRVLRACQLPKSILLEGSPGVGKTTLVQALADASGRHLCRINLSEQTDLIDLFGSDLPVAGGQAGEFAWQDAAFLTAMRKGQWVLLDEMNLASQAILEGLNAVLDHRGSVFIPELGRSFDKHPDFRVFAAQNPVQQGGGRKGLPKSFLNRFTKVYVQEHQQSDLRTICYHLYPEVELPIINGVIEFNGRLQQAVMHDRLFGYEGSPWEFNLRDIIRCFRLMLAPTGFETESPLLDAVRTVYVARFRTAADQKAVTQLFQDVMQMELDSERQPWPSITAGGLQVGHAFSVRTSSALHDTKRLVVLPQILRAQEALLRTVSAGWLTILVGTSGNGKRSLVRQTAQILGTRLSEYSMHPAVDTMEMLGSFEQSDRLRHLAHLVRRLLNTSKACQSSEQLNTLKLDRNVSILQRYDDAPREADVPGVELAFLQVLEEMDGTLCNTVAYDLKQELSMLLSSQSASSFEWVDGPLVTAIKTGGWYLINDANLCSSSVLDRLNSLCELNGTLILSERGNLEEGVEIIKPHPNFRLFMAFDPRNGELSRAMRNRGVEIALTDRLDMNRVRVGVTEESAITGYSRDAHCEYSSALQLLDLGNRDAHPLDIMAATFGRLFAGQTSNSVADAFVILRGLSQNDDDVVNTQAIQAQLRKSLHSALESYSEKQYARTHLSEIFKEYLVR
jgi:midasin